MGSKKPSELHTILGANLRIRRERSGLSQAVLAERIGVSPGYVGDMELGRKFPSPAVLERIAEEFGERPYQLLMAPDDVAAFAPEGLVKTIGEDLKQAIDDELRDIIGKYRDRAD